jgi:hypothetical protein
MSNLKTESTSPLKPLTETGMTRWARLLMSITSSLEARADSKKNRELLQIELIVFSSE